MLRLVLTVSFLVWSTVARADVFRPPILLTQGNTNRAIAVESVLQRAEPFALKSKFAADGQTRFVLFAYGLSDEPGELSARAELGGVYYPLIIEDSQPVNGVPNSEDPCFENTRIAAGGSWGPARLDSVAWVSEQSCARGFWSRRRRRARH